MIATQPASVRSDRHETPSLRRPPGRVAARHLPAFDVDEIPRRRWDGTATTFVRRKLSRPGEVQRLGQSTSGDALVRTGRISSAPFEHAQWPRLAEVTDPSARCRELSARRRTRAILAESSPLSTIAGRLLQRSIAFANTSRSFLEIWNEGWFRSAHLKVARSITSLWKCAAFCVLCSTTRDVHFVQTAV
jgi:hypothetical protein